jgi:hypothetical protein
MIGFLSLAFLLGGCVIGRYYEGPKISEEKLKEIRPGVTTKAGDHQLVWTSTELYQSHYFQ